MKIQFKHSGISLELTRVIYSVTLLTRLGHLPHGEGRPKDLSHTPSNACPLEHTTPQFFPTIVSNITT